MNQSYIPIRNACRSTFSSYSSSSSCILHKRRSPSNINPYLSSLQAHGLRERIVHCNHHHYQSSFFYSTASWKGAPQKSIIPKYSHINEDNNDDNYDDDDDDDDDDNEEKLQELTQLSQATPWRNILYKPARALWRSTPSYSNIFALHPNLENAPPPLIQHLLKEQMSLLQLSQRTKKQLHRTHQHMLERQQVFMDKRKRDVMLSQPIILDHQDENKNTSTTTTTIATASATTTTTTAAATTIKQKKLPKDSLLAQQIRKESGDLSKFQLGNKPEQTCVYLHHRLMTHYYIVERILNEVKSLTPTSTFTSTSTQHSHSHSHSLNIQKVLDFGIGCGSASAAAYSVFPNSIEWIHGIDASTSMREVAGRILSNLPPSEDENKNMNHNHDDVVRPPLRVTLADSLTSDILEQESSNTNTNINTSANTAASLGTFDMALFCKLSW